MQFFITLLVVAGMLLTLLTSGTAGFYAGRVPSGSDAMGLVVPLFAAVAAGLAGVVAGAMVASRGGLDPLGVPRSAATVLIVVAALLIGLSIFGAFIGWAEKYRFGHPALLLLSGFVLPLCYFAFLLFVTWNDGQALRLSPFGKGLVVLTGLAVLSGTVTAGLLLHAQLRKNVRDHVYAMERQKGSQAEEARRASMAPEERLLEDLQAFSQDAPLWSLTAGLPDERSPSLRAIWIERALRLPTLGEALRTTIACEYGNYRHGCGVMIAEAPDTLVQREAWAPMLAKDAELTAADIRRYGDLARHDEDDLAEHVRTIARAAARLQRTEELMNGLGLLRTAVAGTADGSARSACLVAIDALHGAAVP